MIRLAQPQKLLTQRTVLIRKAFMICFCNIEIFLNWNNKTTSINYYERFMLQPEVTSVLTGSCNIETRSHRICITLNGLNRVITVIWGVLHTQQLWVKKPLTVVKRRFWVLGAKIFRRKISSQSSKGKKKFDIFSCLRW